MRFAIFVLLSSLSVFLVLTYLLIRYPQLGPNLWETTQASDKAEMGTSAVAAGTSQIDWRALQRTPGDWIWSDSDGPSKADFGAGEFALVCSPGSSQITLLRGAPSSENAVFEVWTTHGSQRYAKSVGGGGGGGAAFITLDANDTILDAIALSRGHFGIAVEGSDPLLIPSWPEVTRVIEDCRR